MFFYHRLQILLLISFQARIYAEDSLRGFLPSIGPLLKYSEPPLTEDENGVQLIRVDSGVTSGSIISQYYDREYFHKFSPDFT